MKQEFIFMPLAIGKPGENIVKKRRQTIGRQM